MHGPECAIDYMPRTLTCCAPRVIPLDKGDASHIRDRLYLSPHVSQGIYEAAPAHSKSWDRLNQPEFILRPETAEEDRPSTLFSSPSLAPGREGDCCVATSNTTTIPLIINCSFRQVMIGHESPQIGTECQHNHQTIY